MCFMDGTKNVHIFLDHSKESTLPLFCSHLINSVLFSSATSFYTKFSHLLQLTKILTFHDRYGEFHVLSKRGIYCFIGFHVVRVNMCSD